MIEMENLKACGICGRLFPKLVKHHVSYFPERTIMICRSCHHPKVLARLHPELNPSREETTRFYSLKQYWIAKLPNGEIVYSHKYGQKKQYTNHYVTFILGNEHIPPKLFDNQLVKQVVDTLVLIKNIEINTIDSFLYHNIRISIMPKVVAKIISNSGFVKINPDKNQRYYLPIVRIFAKNDNITLGDLKITEKGEQLLVLANEQRSES